MRTPAALLLAPLGLLACDSADLGDRTPADRQARPLVFLDGGDVLVVSPDEDRLSRVTPELVASRIIEVGPAPARVLQVASRAYVSIFGGRVVKVISLDDDALVEVEAIDVCAAPLGMVVNADASRLYVSCTVAEEVVELSLPDHQVLRRFPVFGQPNWIALSPGEEVLYVAPQLTGELVWIELASATQHREPLASRTMTAVSDSPFEQGFRVAADFVVDAEGPTLIVPGQVRPTFYYPVNDPATVPELVVIPIAEGGAPSTSAMVRAPVPNPGRLGAVLLAEPSSSRELWILSGESHLSRVQLSDPNPDEAGSVDPVNPRLGAVILTSLETEVGTRGFAVQGGRALTWSEVKRTVAEFSMTEAEAKAQAQITKNQEYELCVSQGYRNCAAATPSVILDLRRSGHEIVPRVLSEEAERGRELFNGTETAPTACASCHPRGLADAYNWRRPLNRQTPILSGLGRDSVALRWDGSVASLADELRLALGAREPSQVGAARPSDIEALSAYVETLRPPPSRRDKATDACVVRGRAIFNQAETGCSGCHDGADYSGETTIEILDPVGVDATTTLTVRTPSLRGLSASPPYLHDGSQLDLAALLGSTKFDGNQGRTSHLDETQRMDLLCFLESL